MGKWTAVFESTKSVESNKCEMVYHMVFYMGSEQPFLNNSPCVYKASKNQWEN